MRRSRCSTRGGSSPTPSGDAPQSEFPDLLHPNATGYAKWAAALRPVLATLGFVDTTADAFTPDAGFESLFNGRDLTGWGFRPTSEHRSREREEVAGVGSQCRDVAVRGRGVAVRRQDVHA